MQARIISPRESISAHLLSVTELPLPSGDHVN